MGRREKSIDPEEGPVQAFAQELRQLRERAGRPTYRNMSRKVHRSPSALSAAAGGQRLPSLDVMLDYVRACGGDLREFERRWHEVSAALAEDRRQERRQPRVRPLAAGDPRKIGPFRLHGRLGAGAMGVVYLGRGAGEPPVAVKVIRPELADDPGFRGRFRREVNAVRRVRGPHTAPLVDADPDAAEPWLATEYIPGLSLRAAVAERGALPVETVLRLGVGIAEALSAIHAAGVVHRDLKPANVVLADDGPRVIDFGIAGAADATQLTATGVGVGTPGFMAPEQIIGEPPAPPMDVFALGAVLSYAAIGQPPFGEGPTEGILHRTAHQPPDLGSVPAGLRDIITDCLHRDPRRRPTPDEVAHACRALLRDPGDDWLPGPLARDVYRHTRIATATLTRRRRRLVPALAGGVVLLVALALTASQVFAPRPEPIDLIAVADRASWRSGYGPLQWGSGTKIEAGTANIVREAPLENGVRMPTVLAVHPEWVPQGFVEGVFLLPRPIRRGDRFIASVGFFTDESCFVQGCRINGEADFVVFVSDRQIHTVHDVASDGTTPRIDLDLSSYAGATTVRIRVDAGKTAAQDWAGWWDMKIINQ